MASCQNCHKGISYGHAVSHAKNRVKRFFRPNLQSLKVLKNGISIRVSLCTHCIKRLKRDGKIGSFMLVRLIPAVSIKLPEKLDKPPSPGEAGLRRAKEEKAVETLKIESIVGKKG